MTYRVKRKEDLLFYQSKSLRMRKENLRNDAKKKRRTQPTYIELFLNIEKICNPHI